MTRRPRRRRRRTILLGVVAVLVVAYVVVTVVFFVSPDFGTVSRPQAVVVLGGYGDRFAHGLAVARADHVDTVELSTGNTEAACPKVTGIDLHCFAPHPASTQGEARAIAAMAEQHHWDRLLVVAGTTQVTRARLRIGRCYGGQMAFTGVDPAGPFQWIRDVVYDQVAMAKAVLWQWGC
ncbi:MAG TPA: hypothetical protein VIJ60_03895 [Acidimicrobiales bacterium]